MEMASWINSSTLDSLGVTENFIFYVLVSSGIAISFLLLKPLTAWLISSRSVFLVNYIISSLAAIVLILIIFLFLIDLQIPVNNLLKITLQCMAAFGIVMILYYSFQKVIRKI